MGKVIAALIVGGDIRHNRLDGAAFRYLLTDEHDARITHHIALLVGNAPGKGRIGHNAEDDVAGIQARAGRNRGGEVFVLLVLLRGEAAALGRKPILAGAHAVEAERAVGAGHDGASRRALNGGNGDVRARQRLVVDGVDHGSADLKRPPLPADGALRSCAAAATVSRSGNANTHICQLQADVGHHLR